MFGERGDDARSKLTFEVKELSDRLVVDLDGEVDYDNVSDLRDLVLGSLSKNVRKVIFDCTHLEFVDSQFLGLLVATQKYIGENDCVRMVNVQPVVKRLVCLRALDRFFIDD